MSQGGGGDIREAEEDDEEPPGAVAEDMVLKGSQRQIAERTFEWAGRWIAV